VGRRRIRAGGRSARDQPGVVIDCASVGGVRATLLREGEAERGGLGCGGRACIAYDRVERRCARRGSFGYYALVYASHSR